MDDVSSETCLRASSYEPGNLAGSVTRIKFVVCPYYGKFQPSDPDDIQETKPKLWHHINLYSVRNFHSFVDSFNFTKKAYLSVNTFEVEMHTRQN